MASGRSPPTKSAPIFRFARNPRAASESIFRTAGLGYLGKVRPVLILSVAPAEADRALVTYVIRTTSMRGTAYEVPHKARGIVPGAFDARVLARPISATSSGVSGM